MQKFLQVCAEIEDLAASIYRELEKHAEGNPPLQEIMRRMAIDEEDHGRQLRFALRVPAKESFDGVNYHVGDPVGLKLQASQLLQQVRESVFSEYEILKTAVKLENDFQKIHAGYSLLFKDPGLKKLFDALARADSVHVADLSRYLHEYKARLRS